MRPSFNTAGPCFPDDHYMLPPECRLGRVMQLLDAGKVFTLQGPRQFGKTTSAQWLVDHYNAGQRFQALSVDVRTAREDPDPRSAFGTVLHSLDVAVQTNLLDLGLPAARDRLSEQPQTALLRYLRDLASRSHLPLVVMFDEADGLVGSAMLSFLTQLRTGYTARREDPFPHSVALIGARAVRNSVFNIVAEAVSLGAFSASEVEELLAQHTLATGQRFEREAAALIFELTQGHPWLVNALADHIVDRDLQDRSLPVTAAHVEAAKEALILERRTHLDSLVARLREPRVQRIIDPMLAGDQTAGDVLDDDFAYVVGLGIVRARAGRFEIANPIYREVIPRALTYIRQMQIANEPRDYVRADGGLDMPKLMRDWQTFWRKDGHLAAAGFGYRESGPHLMLMAFLQRLVNGGGRVEREYGLGRGALDLMIVWRDERHAVEVKLRRDTETEADALEQVTRYLDHAGLDEGWLVLFDLRSTRPWAERLTRETVEQGGKRIFVVGC